MKVNDILNEQVNLKDDIFIYEGDLESMNIDDVYSLKYDEVNNNSLENIAKELLKSSGPRNGEVEVNEVDDNVYVGTNINYIGLADAFRAMKNFKGHPDYDYDAKDAYEDELIKSGGKGTFVIVSTRPLEENQIKTIINDLNDEVENLLSDYFYDVK